MSQGIQNHLECRLQPICLWGSLWEQQSGRISAIYIPPPQLLPHYFWSHKKESAGNGEMVLVLDFHFHLCVVLTARLILTSSPLRIITIPRQAGSRNFVLQQPDGVMAVCRTQCSSVLLTLLGLAWTHLRKSKAVDVWYFHFSSFQWWEWL